MFQVFGRLKQSDFATLRGSASPLLPLRKEVSYYTLCLFRFQSVHNSHFYRRSYLACFCYPFSLCCKIFFILSLFGAKYFQSAENFRSKSKQMINFLIFSKFCENSSLYNFTYCVKGGSDRTVGFLFFLKFAGISPLHFLPTVNGNCRSTAAPLV